MNVYLRVHPDPKNYDVFDVDSWLFDTKLNEVNPEDLAGTDILFRMTPDQFKKFDGMVPDGMYFRVYPDKLDTDVNHGKWYDENCKEFKWHERPFTPNGTFVIIPATEEEFSTFEALGTYGD